MSELSKPNDFFERRYFQSRSMSNLSDINCFRTRLRDKLKDESK